MFQYRCPLCSQRYVGGETSKQRCWRDGALVISATPNPVVFSDECTIRGCCKKAAMRLRILGNWEHVCHEHAKKLGGWTEQDSINHMFDSL